ncbi:hypothetical protein EH223_14240, partial [candidate division KSB1 bacterium]
MQYRFHCSLLILLFVLLFTNIPLIANDNYSPNQAKPGWQSRTPYLGKINPAATRQEFLLNEDWEYLEEKFSAIDDLNIPDLKWQKIDLPHTWNAFDATDNDPGYRRDASWYRKE